MKANPFYMNTPVWAAIWNPPLRTGRYGRKTVYFLKNGPACTADTEGWMRRGRLCAWFCEMIETAQPDFILFQAERTVLIRRNPFIFPEFSYKVTKIIKSNRKCDIRNRCFWFWQHFAGFFYSIFIDKTDRCLSNFLFKVVAEIIGTHKAYFRQCLQSDRWAMCGKVW